jgi:hypothetical protein
VPDLVATVVKLYSQKAFASERSVRNHRCVGFVIDALHTAHTSLFQGGDQVGGGFAFIHSSFIAFVSFVLTYGAHVVVSRRRPGRCYYAFYSLHYVPLFLHMAHTSLFQGGDQGGVITPFIHCICFLCFLHAFCILLFMHASFFISLLY